MSECRSCNERIVWMKTSTGKNMPVDAETLEPGDDEKTIFDTKRHTSHFSTCPNAAQHRKPKDA
ncbi:MAG: hypothetical protein K2X93_22990 [Candidatus Obscuribacterales bacterium]|nr:hypothetical protein [Candidatus Obscuribacterales bacterium]